MKARFTLLAILGLTSATAARADELDFASMRPEVITPWSICRDTSNYGRGVPASTSASGRSVCDEQGFPRNGCYYPGGAQTGWYFCCYDVDSCHR